MECRITQGGQTLTPPCEIRMETGGTFSIQGVGGADILERIEMISVAGDDSGYQVRGLTKEGVNSRWETRPMTRGTRRALSVRIFECVPDPRAGEEHPRCCDCERYLSSRSLIISANSENLSRAPSSRRPGKRR